MIDDQAPDIIDVVSVSACHRRLDRETREHIPLRRTRWAVNSFKPYKSPRKVGIRVVLLQRAEDILLPHLRSLFRWSYDLSYAPSEWAQVKVVFILKAGEKDTEVPNSYRPISLTSNL